MTASPATAIASSVVTAAAPFLNHSGANGSFSKCFAGGLKPKNSRLARFALAASPIVGSNERARARFDVAELRAGRIEIAADAEADATGRDEFKEVVGIGSAHGVEGDGGREYRLHGPDTLGPYDFGGKHLERVCPGPYRAECLARREDAGIGLEPARGRPGDPGFPAVGRDRA